MITTQDLIVLIVAVAVSILLTFMPGVKDWWAGHTREWRAQTILIVSLVLTVAIYVLSCFVTLTSDAVCPDYTSTQGLINAFETIMIVASAVAGAVQTLYIYGLKPIDDWLTTRSITKKLSDG